LNFGFVSIFEFDLRGIIWTVSKACWLISCSLTYLPVP